MPGTPRKPRAHAATEACRPPGNVIKTYAMILLEGGRPRPPCGRMAKSAFATQPVGLTCGFGLFGFGLFLDCFPLNRYNLVLRKLCSFFVYKCNSESETLIK